MWSASSSLGARNDSALVFDALCSLSAGRIQPTPADRTSKAMSPDVEEGKDEGPTKSAASLPPHSTSASRLVRHQRTKRCCMFLLTVFCGLLILSAVGLSQFGNITLSPQWIEVRPGAESPADLVVAVGALASRVPWMHAVKVSSARCAALDTRAAESVVLKLDHPTAMSADGELITASATLSIVGVRAVRSSLHQWASRDATAAAHLQCSARGWLTTGAFHVPFWLSVSLHATMVRTNETSALSWQVCARRARLAMRRSQASCLCTALPMRRARALPVRCGVPVPRACGVRRLPLSRRLSS